MRQNKSISMVACGPFFLCIALDSHDGSCFFYFIHFSILHWWLLLLLPGCERQSGSASYRITTFFKLCSSIWWKRCSWVFWVSGVVRIAFHSGEAVVSTSQSVNNHLHPHFNTSTPNYSKVNLNFCHILSFCAWIGPNLSFSLGKSEKGLVWVACQSQTHGQIDTMRG